MTNPQATWLRHAGSRALDLLFPPNCVACGEDFATTADTLTDRTGICLSCRERLPPIRWPVCQRCAARVPDIPGCTADCAHCREDKLWFDRALALGEYEGFLQELLLRMKRDRSERLARALGELLFDQLGDAVQELKPDLIAPHPMHVLRRLTRGTNPPAVVAEVLGRRTGVPTAPWLLRRRRNTPLQLGLSRPGRFRNVRGEVTVRASYSLEAAHVLLVDDILTTGASCSEAARVLKRSGAAQVSVIVIGRTTIG